MADHEAHFEMLLEAFKDPRYVTVNGCPVFLVYRPKDIPDLPAVAALWRRLAVQAELPGIFLIGVKPLDDWNPLPNGFDAAVLQKLPPRVKGVPWRYPILKLRKLLNGNRLTIYNYEEVIDYFVQKESVGYMELPCVIPNWDNTSRSGMEGLILHNSNPELFRRHFRAALYKVADEPSEQRIVFLKAWNEWAEGNHVEPDLRFGRAYLEVIREEIEAT